ncbi:MAG: hypothetical protein DWQ07_24475 [Chloroflexi bacterium]|nr:MAG: hypothetical protein DWQ07_24475 [Chloroflexota bacterium]MBL1196289.1 hypothetical protein [Chloroflexota bacterium]NOH13584.1 hypothetical protein [Chloroflexota bacterium]
MLQPESLKNLAYTDDLTPAGIAYLRHNLQHVGVLGENLHVKRMWQVVAEKAVELAFRRHLDEAEVPYALLEPNTLNEHQTATLTLGGRRCHLQVHGISRRDEIKGLQRNTGLHLDAAAYVPKDFLQAERISGEDILVFAYLHALVTRSQQDIKDALDADQPVHFMAAMPKAWSHPGQWRDLGPLVVKADHTETLDLELSGQDEERAYHCHTVALPPQTRLEVETAFFALTHLHPQQLPSGPVGIHSPVLADTYVVEPYQWVNLWVYGMRIVLGAYFPVAEFRQHAEHLAAESLVLAERIPHDAFAMPLNELRPMDDLFVRAKNWESQRKRGE